MEKIRTLGEKLKDLRVSRKLTQPKLAEKVGLNAHTIKDYEAGRRKPSWSALEKLSEVFGVSQSELLDTDAPVSEPVMLPASKTLRKYLSIPDDVVELAFRVSDNNDRAWDTVRAALELAIERQEKAMAKNKSKQA